MQLSSDYVLCVEREAVAWYCSRLGEKIERVFDARGWGVRADCDATVLGE